MNSIKLTALLLFVLIFKFGLKAQMGSFNPGISTGKLKSGPISIQLVEGDLTFLKDVQQVNIFYDYSNMAVGDYKKEADFLDKKKAEYRNEPGTYREFYDSWFDSRRKKYEPKFETMFNKLGEKIGLKGKNYSSESDISLNVETVFTEPGFHAGIVAHAASIDLCCTFTDKEGHELAKYFIKNAPGQKASGLDFDAGSRIVESYAKACKILMKDITKKIAQSK